MKLNRRKLWNYFLLICGSILYPLAVTYFIAPFGLNSGGLVGLCQIISYLLTGSSMLLTGVLTFIINIPLFILAWKGLSRSFLIKTILSLIIQSALLSFLPETAEPVLPDVLASVVFGAVIGGIGVGLCLQSSGSAGGLDILGVYLARKRPDFSVGKLSYAVNFFVLAWAAALFNLQTSLYSVIFILLMYFVCDRVHFQNINVFGLVITSNPELKNIIMKETGRGVTWWDGKGAYTNSSKEILLCVMNKYEVRSYKKIVAHNDPKAFFLLSEGNPINGNFEKRLIS